MHTIIFYHEGLPHEAILTSIEEKQGKKFIVTFSDRRIAGLFGSFEYFLKNDRLTIMSFVSAQNDTLIHFFHDQIILYYLKQDKDVPKSIY
jgi:hypothetical protein